ncbi:major facilitator superfamily domain-containing protein [Phycomyces blakesleeanus]|uniref:Major facilitator superfamily domain-containing protein n=1 Tax=Phycomyces blakesleeanus TaxID=4837 RepID=A0ABR3B445_PHYBL
MAKENKDLDVSSVEQIENVQESKTRQILRKIKDSIYQKPEKPTNVWHLLTNLNNTQRITFAAAFFGWTLDAFDFFSVTLTATSIAKDFGVEPSDVTNVETYCALADKYGRRWPLMIDIVLYSIINMASGFAPNLQTFIGLRAVFGIAMGGEWGLGASLALESLPVEARGLFSGIYQQGYATGYLLATVANYGVVRNGSSWRVLFWVGAAFALLAVIIRFWVPESEPFEKTKEARKILGRSIFKETWVVIKKHWLRLIYMVILMAFMNFLSHGSQDLYPTFLQTQLGYDNDQKTATSVIYNFGAICGGTIVGYYSNYFGRRFCIAVCAILTGAFIPLWAFGPNIQPSVRCIRSSILCVIPAHINELAPPAFRGLMPGLAYQLGNLISAASSQIQAVIGENNPIKNEDGSYRLDSDGKNIANYGLTQAIFMGCVCACLIITVLVGKEERNRDFGVVELEDDRSGRAVGPAEITELSMEQGRPPTSNEEKEPRSGQSTVQ